MALVVGALTIIMKKFGLQTYETSLIFFVVVPRSPLSRGPAGEQPARNRIYDGENDILPKNIFFILGKYPQAGRCMVFNCSREKIKLSSVPGFQVRSWPMFQ